ncbi:hypothetical protein NIES4073_44440 [Kalymmatonema gypsitolerans NIES-4073]|nr:hypothetical protein NIES4073_44440 [Scytonema sp. NIES-4073]
MSNQFIFDSFIGNSTFVSLELGDIFITQRSRIANVIVGLEYVEQPDPSGIKRLQPIIDFIKDYLRDYPHPDLFEVINANLVSRLLYHCDLDLSSQLSSLSVTLDVASMEFSFPFANTITCTPAGESNGLVLFKLEDILIPACDSVADVFVSLDYIDGFDVSGFKPLQPIADFVKDSLRDYPYADLFEVINHNLTFGLLSNCDLELSSVLNSLSITLSVPQGLVPLPLTSTVTATPTRATQLSVLADNLLGFSAEQLAHPFYNNIDGNTLKRFW